MIKIEKVTLFILSCWCISLSITLFKNTINLKYDTGLDALLKVAILTLAVGVFCYFFKQLMDLWVIDILTKIKLVLEKEVDK